jgi:hypothetical protein
MQGIADLLDDYWCAVFGAENEMQINFREGLGHALIIKSPFQGLRLFSHDTQGDALG